MTTQIARLAYMLGKCLRERHWKLVTAESCTGGWIAKAITDIPGSSEWLDCGFITYSNAAKKDLLGVTMDVLDNHGAVSEAVVTQMVQGALLHSHANAAVAVSGIAGPTGGTLTKPVGTVWFAWVWPGIDMRTRCEFFAGDRDAIRCQAVETALAGFDFINSNFYTNSVASLSIDPAKSIIVP